MANESSFYGTAISSRGTPLVGQSVAICSQPANTNTTPCSPLVTTFTDITGATPTGTPGITTTDNLGNFHFYVANGIYTIQIYGPQVSSPIIQRDILVPLGTSTGSIFTDNNTFTGTNTFTNLFAQSLEGVKYADQFSTTSTVSPPVNGIGITSQATGGSVAANSYKCQVTYNGATSGETTPSGASVSVTTTGATSQLICFPNDAPAGAISFNSYWQTGGAGSFFKGVSNVSFGADGAVQTTTPPTSGTTPPVSNTALAVLPTVQTAAGTPGVVVIPPFSSLNLGNPGDIAQPGIIFDYRTASLSIRAQDPSSWMTESGANMNNALNIDVRPSPLASRAQTNGIQASLILGTPSWGNTTPINAGSAGFFGGYRFGTRSELIAGATIVAFCANANAACEGLEIDTNNATGVDANNNSYPVGLNVFTNGVNKSWIGVNIGPSSTGSGAGAGWGSTALNIGDHSGTQAIAIGVQGVTVASPVSLDSLFIGMTAINSGGSRITSFINSTQFGDIVLNSSTNGLVLSTNSNQKVHLVYAANTSLRTYLYPDVSSNVSAASMTTSTYTNATTTPSNITGLSFPVAANTNYTMMCHIYFQGSAGTAGLDITITGPASPTSIFYSYDEDATNTTIQDSVANAFGTKLVGNAAVTATTNLHATVTMGLRNGSNAGTVQVQGSATGAGTVTVQAGSFCVLQ